MDPALATYTSTLAALQSQANQAYAQYQAALAAAGCPPGASGPPQFVMAGEDPQRDPRSGMHFERRDRGTIGPDHRPSFPLPPIPRSPDVPPGPGWEWHGPDAPGGPGGAWVHPDGGSLHWDPKPHPPLGPHWDWVDRYGNKWRYDPTKGKWYPDKQNKPNRPAPTFPPGTLEGAAKVASGGVAVYCLYRIIRMLPSLYPPLWPTIPANAGTP